MSDVVPYNHKLHSRTHFVGDSRISCEQNCDLSIFIPVGPSKNQHISHKTVPPPPATKIYGYECSIVASMPWLTEQTCRAHDPPESRVVQNRLQHVDICRWWTTRLLYHSGVAVYMTLQLAVTFCYLHTTIVTDNKHIINLHKYLKIIGLFVKHSLPAAV